MVLVFFIHKDGTQYESNAHLLSYSSESITLDDRLSMAKVPEQSMRLFSILNSQKEAEKSLEDVEILDSKIYNEIESEYDTVCMVNGHSSNFKALSNRLREMGKRSQAFYSYRFLCGKHIKHQKIQLFNSP